MSRILNFDEKIRNFKTLTQKNVISYPTSPPYLQFDRLSYTSTTGQKPGQKPSQKPAQKSGQKSGQKPRQQSGQKSAQKSGKNRFSMCLPSRLYIHV